MKLSEHHASRFVKVLYIGDSGTGKTGSLTPLVGAGYNLENLERSLFAENITFNSQYVYAQYDFKPLEKLNIIAGARFDNHSEYNSQLSPKLSVLVRKGLRGQRF